MPLPEHPRVDVILPTWCGRRWVFEAVDSVLGQSYERLRLSIVDDASPDGTLDALREHYSGQDPRISFLGLEEQAGAAAARMRALAQCDAPLVGFIDQDDRWLPTKLERQIERLRREPQVQVVHTDIVHIGAAGTRLAGAEPDNQRRAAIGYEALDRDALLRVCFAGVSIRLVTALLRRDAFDAVGGFDARHRGAEEWSLWVRLAAAGHRIAHIPEPLVERREHGGNTSLVQVEQRRVGWFRAIDEVVERHPELAREADPLRAMILRTEALVKLRSGRASEARAPLRRLAALRPGSLEVALLLMLAHSGSASGPILASVEVLRSRIRRSHRL
jgi:glycosyltransferase involved in cell wall biosynthesis